MYSETSNSIRVSVKPVFLDTESVPIHNHFLWAYHIRIENLSEDTIKLCTRQWRITDAHGADQHIQGDGVIGQHPTLKPGETFEYASSAPLNTPSGIMGGEYGMVNQNGEMFNVKIPSFSLDSPYQMVSIQ
ncbi:MAG: Co2+/Mg2+ efflux protein ApaG [Alphaproteobacteria bacterium]|jgi:ApaG protein|nr:Co2+/Mg2+ efflux protein ApaG [Alphaproteobacteria bacterium]MBT5389599.1 Co2+/Mg2+ efflux protein ApaG [Alphaproteobacteria bacterium]MBT5540647.1 Co2+/Mg2+ efflux protein ApaG [Alphaproteobacteria bacterium]MBT5654548.1 Co2+/Mg2+ efflux protein ApaG [Alphaproteobacteria bacterium]